MKSGIDVYTKLIPQHFINDLDEKILFDNFVILYIAGRLYQHLIFWRCRQHDDDDDDENTTLKYMRDDNVILFYKFISALMVPWGVRDSILHLITNKKTESVVKRDESDCEIQRFIAWKILSIYVATAFRRGLLRKYPICVCFVVYINES